MFKRCLVTLLVTLVILSFTGCDNINEVTSGDSYNSVTDSQMTMMGSDPYLIDIAKGEKGYYSYKSKFIYFTDLETFESTPLCFKPNCLHNSDTCNAFIGAAYSIAYNDGYIYYNQSGDIDHEHLGVQFYRMKSDGTGKEKLWYYDYMVMEWTIHRGYLYYVYEMYENADQGVMASENADVYVYRQKLDEAQSNPEEVYFAKEVYKHSSITCPVAIGNNLYFNVNGFSREDSKLRVDNYIKVNLTTFEAQCMKLKDGRTMVYPTLLGNNLVFQTAKKSDGNIDYYKTDFNGENPELFMEVSENERLFTDGTFVYVNNEFGVRMGTDDMWIFKVYDSELKEIDRFNLDLNEYRDSRLLCLDDKVFLFIEESDLGETEISILDKSELGSTNGNWERKLIYPN